MKSQVLKMACNLRHSHVLDGPLWCGGHLRDGILRRRESGSREEGGGEDGGGELHLELLSWVGDWTGVDV